MRNENPRPDAIRDSFISLDQKWDFDFDDQNIGHQEKWYQRHTFTQKIEVPFCFESKLSGIEDTSFHDNMWYHLVIPTPKHKADEDVIIHFEGIDYYSELYINGEKVCSNTSASTGFEANITDFLNNNDREEITIYAYDPGRERRIPKGKQDWQEKSHGIWYTRTSGIWKPVWIEVVNKERIKTFRFITSLSDNTLKIQLESSSKNGRLEVEVFDGNEKRNFSFGIDQIEAEYNCVFDSDYINERIWSIYRPFLFDITLKLIGEDGKIKDQIKSYCGFREVSTKDGKLLINGVPTYLKFMLYQGYFKNGILTPDSIETLKKDIQIMKDMGFNGCRIHQKVEDPYFYYLADKMGFLVWCECPSIYGYYHHNSIIQINEWQKIIDTNFNHPSIIAYTPLNESWGVEGIPYSKQIQAHAMALYYFIHSIDNTRLIISNDGWEQCQTDLLTIHNYGHGVSYSDPAYLDFKKALSTKENIFQYKNIRRFIFNEGYKYEGQPIMLTEFGGIALESASKGKNWGYTIAKGKTSFLNDLHRIYEGIAASTCISGICYTQFSDVEQEVNGLLTYDRVLKVEASEIKKLNDSLDFKF